MRERVDPMEIAFLKSRTRISDIFNRLGYRLRGRAGRQLTLCPFHGEKTPSCLVDDRRGSFRCFGCGERGDHIDILMHGRGLSFTAALEELGGVRPITPVQRSEMEVRERELRDLEAEERVKARRSAQRIWEAAKPIEETHAEAYLHARALEPTPGWTFDLRFASELGYHGFPDRQADDITRLGEFPAMVAAIRNRDGELMGVHRTYLDPREPKKLTPPGDRARNRAKKAAGEVLGGLIWLSEPKPVTVTGEGLETTRSWVLLGGGGDDPGLACGVSLGNLSGRCTASLPHPTVRGRRVPNGEPDIAEPSIVWPEAIEELIFLGDGDSEPVMTRARLLAAMRRAQHQGKRAFCSMAAAGVDWNDVLCREAA